MLPIIGLPFSPKIGIMFSLFLIFVCSVFLKSVLLFGEHFLSILEINGIFVNVDGMKPVSEAHNDISQVNK